MTEMKYEIKEEIGATYSDMPVLHTLICRSYILLYASPLPDFSRLYRTLFSGTGAGVTYSFPLPRTNEYMLDFPPRKISIYSSFRVCRTGISEYVAPAYKSMWDRHIRL
jgi:hypothetical protein